ncbi:MAG: addiction module toxin RelE/StbE, RelE protein [Candidatus Peregrinibacteria bacterium GW2011_GWF2_38_29]|nr:MAG: addiction module toxin RelE/StbE, RelE protein [Candidatus Peregrinibacteria bacterium GW2011_GWF2_38_29]HBB02282.1 type II toxin-antitoxin system mRNA interferase toxin, RelE/StbE family [Candidatus Peregrinibacteria bacterium]
MKYKVSFSPNAEKDMKKLPDKLRLRILLVLSRISVNPFMGKKLDGKLSGHYSFRAWPYRVIYQIFKDKLLVVVVKIGHRQSVYL